MPRIFLDWYSPCLPAAAGWLADHAVEGPEGGGVDGEVDLRETVCVVPGRRAGRMLLRALLSECADRGLPLIPPRILTPGVLAAETLRVTVPLATPAEVDLAWTQAFRESGVEALAAILPAPPETDDFLAWHEFGRTIARVHDELAGEQVTFRDAAAAADRLDLPREVARWQTLALLHERAADVLRHAELVEPATALNEAIVRGEITRPEHLVLIGVVDLNRSQRAILNSLGESVTSLVHAPETLAERFDEFGCVTAESWINGEIRIDESAIVVADRPADQAQALIETIASYGGELGPDEITIGLGDETLAPTITHAASWAGVGVHAATGTAMTQTAPYQLLEAIADWLDEPRFAHLAALLRHPDIERRLVSDAADDDKDAARAVGEWLSLLDQYFDEHLHQRLNGEWLGDESKQRRLRDVYQSVQSLLSPLALDARSMRAWCEPILALLRTVYDGAAGRDAPSLMTIEACLQLRAALLALANAADELQDDMNAASALRLVLAQAGDESVAPEQRADEIEMLGWLELHLDTARAMIVTGFNDGSVPSTATGDAFLPDSLRATLGLMHNARRYARDAYLLESIRHSLDRFTIITGRRSADGEPVTPSRLLLACDDETLLHRVRRFCGDGPVIEPRPPLGVPAAASSSGFVIPELPADIEPPEYMRVTDFRLYLVCPYRFALHRLLKLKPGAGAAVEMDPMRFGSFTHGILEQFGRDESINDSIDPEEIESYLFGRLRLAARRKFGNDPLPAVRVQLARLEQRLRGFAQRQAEWRSAGWKIDRCEFMFEGDTALDIPGQDPMPIRGKIDRIDVHDKTGAWRIIDYKTGESGSTPFEAHHGRKKPEKDGEITWIDLQLPLYHHLISRFATDAPGQIELGYIVLPRQAENVNFHPAAWTPEQLEDGIERARDVVRAIRGRAFDINPEFESRFDDFNRICQTAAFQDDDDTSDGGDDS